MQLTDEHIAEYQMLYRKHFGRDIDNQEALEKGMKLVRFMEIICRSIAQKKEYEKRTKTI